MNSLKAPTKILFAFSIVLNSTAFAQSGTVVLVSANESQNTTYQNVPIEFSFTTETQYKDPFNMVDVDMVVTNPDGHSQRIPAFWAGGNAWKVRYASSKVGDFFWSLECSNRKDNDLNQKRGTFTVQPYRGELYLYKHGAIKVSKDMRHFEHEDSTPFFWMGDTWWMALSRMHWPNDFKELVADRKEKGFNLVQVVAGIFPEFREKEPLPEYAANEGGTAWDNEFNSLRPEYFDAADKRIKHLIEQGIIPCIVGAWGYFMPWMGEANLKAHWRYLIARYGAFPVIWIGAGEANLPYYADEVFPDDRQKQARRWSDVTRYVRTIDPYKRLISVHPTAWHFFTSRHCIDDENLIDFDFLQTPHGATYYDGKSPIEEMVYLTVLRSRAAGIPKPVINGESSYDMHAGLKTPDVPRHNFWISIANGAAGHTYGANGIWQVNGNGDAYMNYGDVTWKEAMSYEAATQIGGAKKWLEKLPWYSFQPYYNWAKWEESSTNYAIDKIIPFGLGQINGTRLFYMLYSKPIVLYQLEPEREYALTYFDPVELKETNGGTFIPNISGFANIKPPDYNHDWVITIEPVK
jgi:hypothetical protein